MSGLSGGPSTVGDGAESQVYFISPETDGHLDSTTIAGPCQVDPSLFSGLPLVEVPGTSDSTGAPAAPGPPPGIIYSAPVAPTSAPPTTMPPAVEDPPAIVYSARAVGEGHGARAEDEGAKRQRGAG